MTFPWRWIVPSALCLAARMAHAQPPAADLDRLLAQEARLSWIEQAALRNQPALEETRARAAAASERATSADRLPDPEFKYEQWAVPLSRPYALNRADALLFGLQQAFPAPGTRSAQGRAASEEARVVADQGRAAEREVLLRIRRAYFDYYAADRILSVHQEHVAIAQQMVDQVRSNYGVGQGKQQDVLKALVELSRLHNDVAQIRQQRESSRFLLNSLMGRGPGDPLGPPVDLPTPLTAPEVAELDAERARERPELSAARGAIRRSEAALDGAKSAARWPSFMVGADYWFMPTQNNPHAYGGMLTMSLPWFSARRRADIREAEHMLAADRHAADAVDRVTSYELHDAVARLEAAKASLEVIERDLLPQAEQSLQANRAAYSVGQTDLLSLLDAFRSYFAIRLEHSQARSRVMANIANVEFASGARLITETSEEAAP